MSLKKRIAQSAKVEDLDDLHFTLRSPRLGGAGLPHPNDPNLTSAQKRQLLVEHIKRHT